MSRSIPQIQNQIIASIQADPILGPRLTSPSMTALWKLWTFIMASSEGIEEQLYDQFQILVEGLLAEGAPQTAPWLRAQVLNFQYNSTTPQLIQFDPVTFAYSWVSVSPSDRIVTRCSVTNETILGTVQIKVAKGTTPAPLTSGAGSELEALQAFIDAIGTAGITYDCISKDSDKLSTKCVIYYNGLYSSTIAASLKTAYDAVLSAMPFDGTIKVSDIITALLDVPGVNDIEIEDMSARADLTSFSARTQLMTDFTEIERQWKTVSGYMVDETESGYDFLSLLTLVSE